MVATRIPTVRPALPTTDKQLWIKLLHVDLEAHPPGAAILAVALHADPMAVSTSTAGLKHDTNESLLQIFNKPNYETT